MNILYYLPVICFMGGYFIGKWSAREEIELNNENRIEPIEELYGVKVSDWEKLLIKLEFYRRTRTETVLDLLKNSQHEYWDKPKTEAKKIWHRCPCGLVGQTATFECKESK